MAVMTSVEHFGVSPKQLVPRLADKGIYLASESTMYRLQHRLKLREQARPATCPRVARATVIHRATGPNQVWSWDITYLPTPVRGQYLYLYLVIDVWSRRIVGWRVHERESPDLAARMIAEICNDECINPTGLVLHFDNGKPMSGATMVSTLQWLGIIPSFSRPHVSDDNPHSEALFRTLKYTPAYPRYPFAGLAAARTWVTQFVGWYNDEHRQRYSFCHAEPAALRARRGHPRSATRPLRTRPAKKARALVTHDSQLRRHRSSRPAPRSNRDRGRMSTDDNYLDTHRRLNLSPMYPV